MNRKIQEYIREQKEKGYSIDIPDEAPIKLETLGKVPSYRRIAIAILKNDHHLTTLGKQAPHSHFYDELKRIELSDRMDKFLSLKK